MFNFKAGLEQWEVLGKEWGRKGTVCGMSTRGELASGSLICLYFCSEVFSW